MSKTTVAGVVASNIDDVTLLYIRKRKDLQDALVRSKKESEEKERKRKEELRKKKAAEVNRDRKERERKAKLNESRVLKVAKFFAPNPKKTLMGVPIGIASSELIKKFDKCVKLCDPTMTRKLMVSSMLAGHPGYGLALSNFLGGTYRSICISSCKANFFTVMYDRSVDAYRKDRSEANLKRLDAAKKKANKWAREYEHRLEKAKLKIETLRKDGQTMTANHMERMVHMAMQARVRT